ncbi:MAG: hypothetical protein WCW52_09520 [Elusimicrobiales bacterium]|jgi:hypothetical protein
MKNLVALAMAAVLTQALSAANLEGSRGGAELLRLAAQSGAELSEPAAPDTVWEQAEAVERAAALAAILDKAEIFAGTPGAGHEAAQLRNYLRSPRAAAGLRDASSKADRLSAIDAIWALGELRDGASIQFLKNMLPSADRTVRLNLLAALKKMRAAPPETIAKLEEAEFSAIPPGDILFREGNFGILSPGLPVGHTGIFAGMENRTPMMIHSTSKYGGVAKGDMEIFIAGHPYYGNRTTAVRPTAEQRAGIISWLTEQYGKPYDTLHSTQKGPDTFDCVGLTEAAYEHVGLNPTPDELEAGPGWPLEPYEQYEYTVAD